MLKAHRGVYHSSLGTMPVSRVIKNRPASETPSSQKLDPCAWTSSLSLIPGGLDLNPDTPLIFNPPPYTLNVAPLTIKHKFLSPPEQAPKKPTGPVRPDNVP